MKRVIVIVVVLASFCLLTAKSQTLGWLGVSSKQVKSEIEQMLQMEEKALEQELLNFEKSGNWMKTDYLEQAKNITDQELMRRFQVIRNEERTIYEDVNIALETWMFDVKNWTLADELDRVIEDEFLMSGWMFDDDFWKLDRSDDNENIALEDWMFSEEAFTIQKNR